MLKSNKIKGIRAFIITMMTVLFFATSAWATFLLMPDNAMQTASADAASVDVSLKDLKELHGIDYVIGPIKNTTEGGMTYNNEYGIPSDQYFDYTNYLYIVNNVLYGWKNDIAPARGKKVNANGTITGQGGTYIHESGKYVIVLPDNVTKLGKGNYHYSLSDGTRTYTNNGTNNGYTSFSIWFESTKDNVNYNWVPVERLAGFYCSSNSNLTEIEGITGSAPAKIPTAANSCNADRPTLYYCNNMRFCILPNNGKLKTIGRMAFHVNQQLRDINIPTGVTSIGEQAFTGCSSLKHITIPDSVTTVGANVFSHKLNSSNAILNSVSIRDVENNSSAFNQSSFPGVMNYYSSDSGSSQLYAVASSDTDKGKQAIYFCKNSIQTGVLATISNANADYAKAKWYAVGLVGPEDPTKSTIYELPATVSAGANDKRRTNIVYDYIGSDGKGRKNTLSEGIQKYDIASEFVSGTWFGNVIIPETVEVIGDRAFYYTHMQYLELGSGIQKIGTRAFYDTYRYMVETSDNAVPSGARDFNGAQYYYIHSSLKNCSLGTEVFNNPDSLSTSASKRYYIFDSSSDCDSGRTKITGNSALQNIASREYTYTIPIKAVVESADDVLLTNDMDTLFKHDSDYTGGTYKTKSGNTYTITYTKRLYNNPLSLVKTDKGYWTTSGSFIDLPNIIGNESTKWYSSAAHSGSAVNSLSDDNNIYSQTGAAGKNIIYSKKVAAPAGNNAEWIFDEGVTKSFNSAIGLNDDYTAKLISYTDIEGDKDAAAAHNAGTYVVYVQLADKWGAWSDATAKQYQYTITIGQKPIDLGDLSNLPEFRTQGGMALGGTGEGAVLRHYEDGWYLYEKSDNYEPQTVTVLNSFVRYTKEDITIVADTTGKVYSAAPVSTSEYYGVASRQYMASFTFSFGNNNYVFTNDSKSENQNLLNLHGVIVTITNNGQSASLTKNWYIVTQGNWFVDSSFDFSNATENALLSASYALATKNGAAISEWTYEDSIDLHLPALAYDNRDNQAKIVFSLLYNGIDTIVEGEDITKLSKYINSAMPAGTYTVLMNAGSVTLSDGNYPEINERFTLTVAPKAFDSSAIENALTGKTFEHAYSETMYLHDDIASLLNALNSSLNVQRKNAKSENNYWKEADDKYYGIASMSYNLDDMRSSEYLANPGMPVSVGSYIVYYSISALNYKSVGGENAANRRDFVFTTVIYRQLSASGLIDRAELTYTGSQLRPTVTYSPYYTYSFNDTTGYTNVGEYTVTITISDNTLSRWNESNRPNNVTIEGGVATITFNIAKANNSWRTQPQIPSWSYNGFDSEVYTIKSLHNFAAENLTVYYGLYHVVRDEDGVTTNEPVVFGTSNGEPVYYFTVNASGEVNANIAAILNGLVPGTYRLASYISGNANVNQLDERTYADIIIGKAANSWTTSPNIIPWTWGNYNSSVNVIAAVAEYDENESNITYSILYAGSGEVVEGLASFKSVTANIENIFKALPAGNYILRTELSGTDYYVSMNPSNINFTISQAQNYWAKTPNVIRWKWSEYSSTVNLVTATPAYSQSHDGSYGVTAYESPVVRYTILNSEYKLPAAVLKNFVSVNGVVSTEVATALAALPVGTYYLIPCLEARNNYSAINASALNYDFADVTKNETLAGTGIEFSISIIANSWETAPNMTGWDYRGFNATANFIAGDPHFKVENANVQYTISSDDGVIATFSSIDSVTATLTALSYGTYTFKATYVDGKPNFDELEKTTTFMVRFVSTNTWSTDPAVTGWVYGSFNQTYVTEAVDLFQSAISYTLVKEGSTDAIFENLTFAELITELEKNDLDADSYSLTVRGEDTTNYNVVFATRGFEISKAANEWNTIPAISGWTYGAAASVPATGTTKQPNGGLTSAYYTVTVSGAAWSLGEKLDGQPTDAGNYAYVTTADKSTNYQSLTYTSYFTIGQATNGWNSQPTVKNWVFGGQIPNIEFVPKFDAENTLSYVVDGEAVSASELADTINGLGAGPHTVLAVVEGNDNYTGLNTSITLTVTKATNLWLDDKTVTNSLSKTQWEWKTEVTWSGLKPKYGDIVYVIITKADTTDADSDSALYYITVDYLAENAGYLKAIDSVGAALTLLDVGSYRVTVTAPSDDNWNEFTKDVVVTVDKAKNGWKESGAPSITSSWIYGATGATPSADAKHGDVIIKYYTFNDRGERILYGTQQPVNAGSYAVGFSVIEDDNWLGITETYLNFTIEKDSDPSFIVYPSAVGWVWKTYDREVNLFSGIPRTGGEVSYSILLNDNVVEVDGTKLENITLVGLDDKFNNNLNEDLYVSTTVGKLLAKLTANTYKLRVSVAATQNYVGFPTDIRLDVTAAENVWEVTPQVAPWAVYYWTSDSTPKAEPRFGIATITITSAVGNREYYKATYNSETKETDTIISDLQDAPAGWYYLEAKVPALPGCYNNALGERVSERIEFQIFVEGNTTQDNYWRVMPRIADWTANSDGIHSDPVGEPLRGKAYFTFYTAVRVNGAWTKVDAITEANGTKVTVVGSYGYTYFLPIENGDYIMVAEGIFRDQSGEIVEGDAPETLEVHFEVLKRINEFTAEPRIETLLYLGDRDSWELPTAEVKEGYVTYSYRLWGTDDEFSEEVRITDETDVYKLLPGDPGVYQLKATSHALYADDIEKFVKFEVKLSPNSWLSSPSIKDWSEEVDPNNPFGEATVGSEYITYEYASADSPDVKFKTKPTTEGTYIVYATLKMDGYETITSQATFTITSAYDRQLLILDIILGIIACASAVVVIYFAVRRYKENG